MRAYSTADISLEDLHELNNELGPDFELQVDERQTFYKGGIPPSWVVFFADAGWLIKALGGGCHRMANEIL